MRRATLLCLILAIGGAWAGAAESDVAALLDKTGIHGGLCLLVGAKDASLPQALVATSTLYVQVLEPDARRAAEWGAALAAASYREQIGVRNAAFDAGHYGTNLFNLIVVEDAGSLGTAGLADLLRIAVPNGCVAFRHAPAQPGGEAVPPFAAVFRKPLQPEEWRVCDSIRWRAGPRAQYCCAFAEIALRDGTLSYLERMEVPGDIVSSRPQLFVRDAWNGRTLRTEELPDQKPNWYVPAVAATLTFKVKATEKIDMPKFGNSCFPPIRLGKYFLYHHNIWVDLATDERVFPYLAHPACSIGHVPGNGLLYNFPSRKNGCLAGVSAIGPADIAFGHEPGGKVLQKSAETPTAPPPPREDDWPMFRANPARGNFVEATVGEKLAKSWEATLGLGGKSFGVMNGQRTGLTQAVCAAGLVVVADIDSQRVVALNAEDGKQRWTFHVGSRVDFPPTLYKGLCLFAAKDGWVYCLNAQTGKLVWRLLAAPRERYIGGQEKLESLWPTQGDVLVSEGVGYASAGFGFTVLGGARALAFKPETGEVLWSQCYHHELPRSERQAPASIFVRGGEKALLCMSNLTVDPATGKLGTDSQIRPGMLNMSHPGTSMDDYLAYGNSLSRTNEDRAAEVLADRRLRGRVIAFSPALTVAYTTSWGGEGWDARTNKKVPVKLGLTAAREAKQPLWEIADMELVVDDLLLTPRFLYCVGHYQRIARGPELWVVSPEDGKVLDTVPVAGFPAFNGMSAAGDRLFVATREGKLICYR